MEWDEVETAELFQKFESFAAAKFTELRQKHWKECTAAISDVRKMITELRAGKVSFDFDLLLDFEEGLSRVNSEKAELEKELEKCQEMIEGKNLELLGLRRQLRSYNLSKNICKKCECVVPEVEGKLEKEQTDQGGRKRARFNLSLSSSESPDAPIDSNGGLTRKPSEKRLCLATSNGQVAVEINKQKNGSNKNGCGDAPNVLVPETQQESPSNGSPESRTLTDGVTTHNNSDVGVKPEEDGDQSIQTPMSDPLSRRTFGLSALSPPSTYYDASAAIRRAVNHLDLANYEPSIIATPSQISKQSRNRVGGQRAAGHASRHVHKKTCRHYQSPPKRPTTGRRSKPVLANDLLSDATGADLTFPSISTFAEAADPKQPTAAAAASKDPEAALMPPPPPPDSNVRVTRRSLKRGDIDNLPSLGGSPTAQKNIETQLPDGQANPSKRNSNANRAALSPNNNKGFGINQCNECVEYLRSVGLSPSMIQQHLRTTARHTHLSPRGRKCSSFGVGTSALSTPHDFWSIGALSPPTVLSSQNNRRSSAQSSRRPDVGAALRRLRRRRPLEMPKRS
ncbi:unnamed protein product [Rodentolepis nana]|uniref:DNA endonuclease RBBP8 n=1 Tax=Rodentolepis nana TaxID=102285 RepID=A0A0R3T850_RODNA|nr:unnamed protein product [Rodentolepis nana]